jgi:hypothetical protein
VIVSKFICQPVQNAEVDRIVPESLQSSFVNCLYFDRFVLSQPDTENLPLNRNIQDNLKSCCEYTNLNAFLLFEPKKFTYVQNVQ